MFKPYFIFISAILAVVVLADETLLSSTTPLPYTLSDLELKQNREAQYAFSTNIDDHISDLTHSRQEVRDGLNVKGSYSFRDGYYARTVHYEADDKGYRVTKIEAVPLEQDGPKTDISGTAQIVSNTHGKYLNYVVQSVPLPHLKQKFVIDEEIA